MTHPDPRAVAWAVMNAVDERSAYANLLLPNLLRRAGLSRRDSAFVTELTYTALRWRGFCDAVLESAAGREIASIDLINRNVLRLGAASWLFLETPAHAAVSSTVDLAAEVGNPRSRGFVNAVMRRVVERDCHTWTELVAMSQSGVDALAASTSHPSWIVAALRDALIESGRSIDELPDALLANNQAGATTLVARPGLCTVADLQSLPAVTTGRWADTAAVLQQGDPGAISQVADGYAGVQDEGSQLVALITAGIALEGPDARWLDMCAGPGGKAALLAALAHERGAQLTAVELQSHRARLVESALRQLPSAEVRCADATNLENEPWFQTASYDRVLVDVPCSGLGALRRRPDLRWHRQAADIAPMLPLQRDLLVAAGNAVRTGGIVAYATCSPHLAETKLAVAGAIKLLAGAGIHLEQVDLTTQLPTVPRIAGTSLVATNLGRPHLQLWPHIHGTDGMYLSIWRRS